MPTIEIGMNEMELIKLWGEWLAAVDAYQEASGAQLVQNLKTSMMQKIRHYVAEENPFTAHDESLYASYGTVMAHYQETLSLYQESMAQIDDLKIGEILGGICEILSSRLKLFEEYSGTAAPDVAPPENPIAQEKQVFLQQIEDALAADLSGILPRLFVSGENDDGQVGGQADSQATGQADSQAAGQADSQATAWIRRATFRQACFDSGALPPAEAHGACQQLLYQKTLEAGADELHQIYTEARTRCVQNINNLDVRKNTRYFYDGLGQEKETLDSIVKIQLQALSAAAAQSAASEAERTLVETIAKNIRETNNSLTQQYQEIYSIYNGTNGGNNARKAQPEDAVQLATFLKANCMNPYIGRIHQGTETAPELAAVSRWQERRQTFLEKFEKRMAVVADVAADIRPYRRFIYEMRKRITDKMILTDEMMDNFRRLSNFYIEKKDEIPQDDYKRIIDGIQESIGIKLDVLEENKTDFETKVKEKLDRAAPPPPTEADEKALAQERLAIWLAAALDLDVQAEEYTQKAQVALQDAVSKMKQGITTKDYNEKLDRQIGWEIDEFMKIENNFLKDYLLYEVGTFEEIQTYSVSKLRESEDAFAKEYVKRCEALDEATNQLLKQHGIDIIAPKPFDQFNSAEHEVLVAEKNDAFKKGQIIKPMNAGYRYGDHVLIRANVIAAK